MLTDSDLRKIGEEVAKVLEENVTPAMEEMRKETGERFEKLEVKMSGMDMKLDRALYRELGQHELRITQLEKHLTATR